MIDLLLFNLHWHFFIGIGIWLIVTVWASLGLGKKADEQMEHLAITDFAITDRDNELKTLNELLEKQDKTIYNQKLKINELLKVNNELREETLTKVARSN